MSAACVCMVMFNRAPSSAVPHRAFPTVPGLACPAGSPTHPVPWGRGTGIWGEGTAESRGVGTCGRAACTDLLSCFPKSLQFPRAPCASSCLSTFSPVLGVIRLSNFCHVARAWDVLRQRCLICPSLPQGTERFCAPFFNTWACFSFK